MRAVNLIPLEARSARGLTAAGKSGGLVYALLGILAVLVVAVSAQAFLGRQAAQTRQETAVAAADAARLGVAVSSYSTAQAASEAVAGRITSIRTLADSRTAWDERLRDLSRLTPAGVRYTALTASTAPGTSTGGGSGSELRGGLQVPAMELTGCARSSTDVAATMSALRGAAGVQRVTLDSSTDSAAPGGPDAGGCDDSQSFSLVVFLLPTDSAAPSTTPTAAP